MQRFLYPIALAGTLMSTPAAAQDVITNGGFEDGRTGWYHNQMIFFDGPGGNGHDNSNGYVSSPCAGSTCNGTYNQGAYFGQAVNTVRGASYDLSFWVAETGGATSAFSVFWDGQLVNTTMNPNNSSGLDGYRQFTFSGLFARGTTTDLQIQGRHDPAGISFDDISAVSAQTTTPNLVRNGDFEAGGDYWYTSQVSIFDASGGAGHNDSEGYAASPCAGSFCNGTYDQGAYFGQALNTIAGATYDLSFWVAEMGGETSAFSVFWDGRLINTTYNPNNNSGLDGYRQFVFRGLTATGSWTDLQIQGRHDPAGIYFDDISVVASVGSVPEPGIWAMMIIGFGATGAALRRRPRPEIGLA